MALIEIEQRLTRAVDDLYATFKKYKQPTVLDAPPHREPEKLLRQLGSVGLRDLQPEQIGSYAGWALTTVGGADEYRHFLPRIVELAAHSPFPSWGGFEPCSIARRLWYAGWKEWPATEQEAIKAAFLSAWDYALNRWPDGADAIGWLEGIALAEINLAQALELWLRSPTPKAMLRCADFAIKDGTLSNRWKDIKPEIRARVVEWLLTAPVRGRLLETAADAALDEGDRDRALHAAAILENMAGVR